MDSLSDQDVVELTKDIERMNSSDKRDVAEGGDSKEEPVLLTPEETGISSFKSTYMKDFDHQECLGKGGWGIVFKAKHKIDEISYAIKRIKLPDREEKRKKVIREAKALARLDHHGIVRYFNSWREEPPFGWQHSNDKTLGCYPLQDYKITAYTTTSGSASGSRSTSANVVFEGVEEDSGYAVVFESETSERPDLEKSDLNKTERVSEAYLYIQMQLCQKDTLRVWLDNNTKHRDQMEILDIFGQIVRAVQYIHDSGMIHRDLKPSNIFHSMDGVIKIGDFGLVTAIDMDASELESDTSGVKSANDKIRTSKQGTWSYMSPEQLSSLNYDNKVDIYPLGLIFLELKHPFSTGSERARVMTNVKNLILPEEFSKDHPTESQFIIWLLTPTPAERPDCGEILESKLFRDIYRDYISPRQPSTQERYSSKSSARTPDLSQPSTELKYSDMIFLDPPIGRGSFSTVYKVELKQPYKGYRHAAAKSLWILNEKEVQILKNVDHPNIVEFFEYFNEAPNSTIVMELANETLRSRLDTDLVENGEDLKKKWIREAADAIQYLHNGIPDESGTTKPVVHRDIKAVNCLLLDCDVLKLCDFGIAREADCTKHTKYHRGTEPYMAPELLRPTGGVFSTATDIYAYGVLVWEILTQEHPQARIDANKSRMWGQPITTRHSIPGYLDNLLQSCWAEYYQHRPSISTIISKLDGQYQVLSETMESDGSEGIDLK